MRINPVLAERERCLRIVQLFAEGVGRPTISVEMLEYLRWSVLTPIAEGYVPTETLGPIQWGRYPKPSTVEIPVDIFDYTKVDIYRDQRSAGP